MAICLSETCGNQVKGRRYCSGDCKVAQRHLREDGPKVADLEYREVEANLELLKDGAWMVYPEAHGDNRCIADFIRVWKRPPAHVIFDPATPMWRFAGPVHTKEELKRRWQNANE